MDKSNDAAQDELQQAINNITNGVSADDNDDVISQIEEQVAAAKPAPAPEIPAPEAPSFEALPSEPISVEPVMPTINAEPAKQDDKAEAKKNSPAPTKLSMEPERAVYGDPDLDKVKANALSDIRPIIEKIDIAPEKKFLIYKDIIELWDDKSCIEPAYDAAKEISDEKERAEALLYIIEMIDNLGLKNM